MDDVNINKICMEEVELDGEEKEWIKLSWISSQSNDDENFQSSEIQRDLDNEIAPIKDCDNKMSFTNVEPEDISDGISVITESDTDAVNTNLFQICQVKPLESPQILEMQINRQKDTWNIITACVLGVIIGLALNHFFTNPETYPVSNRLDAESLKTASHDIVNTCKELTDVKIMLKEIKAQIPVNKKISKQLLAQFFEIIDSSDETDSKTSSKPIMTTKEFFNVPSPHPLDQLQDSLHVLSSLAFICNDNSSFKNEINKALDIVNNTKVFYDTLILSTNNTQDEVHSVVLNLLQHSNDEMHITSKVLLSNLIEKVSKATLKVYNKYAKERHRLNKKLCHLKSILPNDKFLKQLTENNQLFKDYDKSCFNYTSKKLASRTVTKGNTKIKERVTQTDNTVLHPKYVKKNNHRIHDTKEENFLKNKRNKKQNVDKSMKFLQNTSHNIRNISQLLVSEVLENINKLRHQLNKKLQHLKNILPNNSEILKQLIKDNEGDNKESIKHYKEKDDYLQSNIISKNGFDNILMQLKNTCPFSTNYCPKFNSTFDIVPNHKTKNYKDEKHTDSKKKEESRPKKKDYFKSNESTKKIVNSKANYEGKNISSQNKIKNHTPEHIVNNHKTKNSSFNDRTIKQDNQHYTNTDRRSDSKRFYEYKKQRQRDDSDWYFRRAYARRNARRHAEYIYQQSMKGSRIWDWKNRR